MKILNTLCVLSLLSQPAFAEPTPAGTTPTYTNENGGFTYYYASGEPVPPGVRAMITPIGVAFIMNSDGSSGESIYATKADAAAASNYKPDCSGAVFGPGPGGIPAGCPGSSNSLPGGSGASATAVDDKTYDKASFELTTILYAANEVGAKSCVPAGTKMPGSLSSWATAFKAYLTGEAARDKKLDAGVEALQKKIQQMTSNTVSKDMQADGIQVQIDMVDASIESLNGTGGRIPLREKLLVAALNSLDENGKENIKTVETYKKMVNEAFENSLSQAKAACERKKKVKTCTTDEEGNEECTEKEEKDPVKGCEVAIAQIPAMKSGPAQTYAETYLTASMPSTEMNNKLESYETEMTNIMAAIPRSDDGNYDWSTPMEEGLKAMKTARKDSGTKCAGAGEASGKEKITKATDGFLTSLGLSGESSNKVAETFGEIWTATDNVIGQAAFRGEYFTVVAKKINELLIMDRSKLSTLLATRAKLENYQTSLKTQLAAVNGGDKKTSTTSTSSTSASTAPAKIAAAAQTTTTTTAAIGPSAKINLEASTQSQTANKGSVVSTSSKLLTNAAPSLSTTSASSLGTANNWSGLSLSAASMAMAKKNIDSIAKNDKKLSTMVTTTTEGAMNNSGSGSSKSSAKTKTATPTMFTIVNNDSGEDSVKGSMDKTFAALNKSSGAEEIYKAASFSGRYSDDSSYSSGSSGRSGRTTVTSTSSSYSKPDAAVVKSSSVTISKPGGRVGGRAEASADEPSNDAKLVSQSIVAKKFKKKDAYAAAETDSLFQRVTKAYIRNYEKVEEPGAVSAEETNP